VKKILVLIGLIFLLSGFSAPFLKVSASERNELSANESASFICSKLDEINGYLSTLGEYGPIEGCSFSEISITEFKTEIKGVYIDFFGDNGYMVVGPKLLVYDYAFYGNSLVETKKRESLRYNVLEGFSYNGMVVENGIANVPMNTGYDTSIAGVNSSGAIYDLSLYVNDVYGPEYTLFQSENATNRNGEDQMALSVYKKEYDTNGDGIIDAHASEGNCGLVSAYTLLKFLQI
jgi:hypothetical protein